MSFLISNRTIENRGDWYHGGFPWWEEGFSIYSVQVGLSFFRQSWGSGARQWASVKYENVWNCLLWAPEALNAEYFCLKPQHWSSDILPHSQLTAVTRKQYFLFFLLLAWASVYSLSFIMIYSFKIWSLAHSITMHSVTCCITRSLYNSTASSFWKCTAVFTIVHKPN